MKARSLCRLYVGRAKGAIEELTNLRLALATFALQLDAFEARLKGRSPKTTLKAFHPAQPYISVANKIVAAIELQPQFAGIGRGGADPDFQDFAPIAILSRHSNARKRRR